MPVEKQVVSIPFVGGVDTKTDEHVLPPDRLAKLINGEFVKHGSVRARPGTKKLTSLVQEGTEIDDVAVAAPYTAPTGLFTRGEELVLPTMEHAYSADPLTDRYTQKQHYPAMTHTLEELSHVPAAQNYCSVATAGGIRAAIWEDSRGGIRYSVFNESTGAAYVYDKSIAASNVSRPWAVPMGSRVLLLWADHSNNEIRGKLLNPGNLQASIDAAHTVYVGDLAASRLYAVTTDGNDVYFTYSSDGSVVAAGVALATVSILGVTRYKVSVSADVPTSLDVSYNSANSTLNVIWYDGVDVDQRTYQSSTGAPAGAAELIATAANVVKVACGPFCDITGFNSFSWAYETSAASADLHTVDLVDALGDATTLEHSHLVSSGFQRNGLATTFIVGHDSRTGLQNAYYLVDSSFKFYGQLLYQAATDRSSVAHLTRVWANGTYLEVALGFKRQLDAEGTSAVFTHNGLALCTFNPNATVAFAEAGNTAYLSGSWLWAYDGGALAEAVPAMYPDMLAADVVGSSSTGLLTVLNQYSYRVYYVRQRANGERVYSAALTVSKTLGEGADPDTDDTITLTIPTLQFTRCNGLTESTTTGHKEQLEDIYIEVYRTVGNDTSGLYYKVSGTDPATVAGSNRFVYNDPSAPTVTFVDELADTAILSRGNDYLSRGEVPNIPPPAPALLATFADRVYLAGGAIPKNTCWYSKLRFPGEPAVFSDLLAIEDLPEATGSVTALSQLNETLVVFTERGIASVVGNGYDNTGSSGGYQSKPVTADLGCSGTTVVMPQGVMFTSPKGIYLLDQSWNVQYVGAPVESFNNQVFSGACVIPGTNQVLFLNSTDGNETRSLMFDYLFGQWSTWTLRGSSLVVWQDTFAFVDAATSMVFYRDSSEYADAVFTDAGSTYPFVARTGAFRTSDNLQGFARLRRFGVLGRHTSAHRLQVDMYYDRESSPFESFTWDPSTVIDSSTWGSDATWGSGSYWGGSRNGNTYQFEHRPKRQKFSTIRFEFSMIPGVTPGAGYELIELGLEVGLKPQTQRHSAGRKY